MTGTYVVSKRADLHASLHALSQPLTVVSLALTLAQSATSEAERSFALESAAAECQRAMDSVRQLRSLVDRSAEAKLPAVKESTGVVTNGTWKLGGAA